jgi:hypothetical protein
VPADRVIRRGWLVCFVMRASKLIFAQVDRALHVAFALSGLLAQCAIGGALLVPAFAGVAAGDPALSPVFWTAVVLACAAGFSALGLAGARGYILLRAGLWVRHEVGERLVAQGSGVRNRGLGDADLQALETFGDGLARGAVGALLDAPWMLAGLGVMVLVHPLLAGTAACALMVQVIAAVVIARAQFARSQQAMTARLSADQSWRALSRSGPVHGLPWPSVHGAYVALAYRDGGRAIFERTAALVLAATGSAGLLTVGCGLISYGVVSVAGFGVCLLLWLGLMRTSLRLADALCAAWAMREARRHLIAALAPVVPATVTAFPATSNATAIRRPMLEAAE